MAKRRKTHLTLEDLTLGYLRYLKENNVVDTNYEIIDILLDAFMINYAEENDLNISDIREKSLELQKQSLRPQSKRSKEENRKAALKSMAKINTKERVSSKSVLDMVSDSEVDEKDILKNFMGGENNE